MEIRCDTKKFGELTDDGWLEIKCPSKFCGAAPGTVVIHRFDPDTGKLVETKRFRDPGPESVLKGGTDAARHDSAAVRSA